MISKIFYTALFLMIALGGGVLSFDRMTEFHDGFSKLILGVWQASPSIGTEDQDVYAKAFAARFDIVPLGSGEGLIFEAWHDENQKPLNPACTYELSGILPETRFFTLYAVAKDKKPFLELDGLPTKLYSRTLFYKENGSISIRISPTTQPGNWLAVSTAKPYGLMLTLYNTSVARTSGLHTVSMPKLNLTKQAGQNCG